MRTKEELAIRSKPILDQPDIVMMVESSSSPTAVYDVVMSATEDADTAKAARWLGILKRDHPAHYAEITATTLRHAQTGTAQKGSNDEYQNQTSPSSDSAS